jgi:hypothetical protein
MYVIMASQSRCICALHFYNRLYTTVPVFLIGSSFVHYGIYIATYYHRPRDVAFIAFKNTVMTFKVTALLQLAYIYCTHFSYDAVSLGLIVAGFASSTAAAAALGLDRTYFGYELGVVPPSEPVTAFPYNVPLLQHPMIVGNLLWLAGVYKMQGFRDAVPWLAPVHMALYTVHMLQEHFDVKKAEKLAVGATTDATTSSSESSSGSISAVQNKAIVS